MQMHYSGVSGVFLEGASPGPQGASQLPSIRGGDARRASLHGYAIKTALIIVS
jgi:hypothetical protein